MTAPTLMLGRAEIAALMRPADYLAAVERGFRASTEGRAGSPAPMHIAMEHGGFHAKGAYLRDDADYVVVKLNGNFPTNPKRNGLPTIQGAVLLCDADNGSLLAILDSGEVTLRRTAAASALAAKHLARADASTLAICGCGAQAMAQVEAIADVRTLTRATAWDADPGQARRFAAAASEALRLPVVAAASLDEATRDAGIIVTCTTSYAPFLGPEHVASGAFVAAAGADHAEKSELTPALMAAVVVVVDSLDQCVVMGDLHHAVAAGAMQASAVRGALADIVIGKVRGRTNADEIIVFDSTGTAIQDVASAAAIFGRARQSGRGVPFHFT